jgi:hypothetical protein
MSIHKHKQCDSRKCDNTQVLEPIQFGNAGFHWLSLIVDPDRRCDDVRLFTGGTYHFCSQRCFLEEVCIRSANV